MYKYLIYFVLVCSFLFMLATLAVTIGIRQNQDLSRKLNKKVYRFKDEDYEMNNKIKHFL